MACSRWPKVLMKRFDAIIFDLDGTLIDSAPVIGCVFNEMRQTRGKNPWPTDSFREWISLGAASLVCHAMEVPAEAAPPLLDEFRHRYALTPTPKETLYLGVPETLTALHSRGFKLAICSNKPEPLCHKVLRETGLEHFFTCVVGGGKVARPKPDRMPLDFCLASLSVTPDRALFVGDSTVDQRAASAAGVPFAFFEAGYDDGVAPTGLSFQMSAISDLLDQVGLRRSLRA
jgi:phosphoglycolate phosphatase